MTKATLLVNPAAGQARRLAAQLPAITQLLKQLDYQTRILATTHEPDSAKTLARQAAQDSQLVIACGGDGTIHGAIQGLAHTQAAVGILPLGTANALARNLRLPLDPLKAIERLLTYTPTTIPLGEIATPTTTRLFTVMAGCGPDGALIHSLSTRSKSRFGRTAYYTHAGRLFLTRRWPTFEIQYRVPNATSWTTTHAVALMSSRVPNLGGLFSGLTPRASLLHPNLHTQLILPPASIALPAWFTRLPNPWLQTIDAEEIRCTGSNIHAQADGEPLGPIPITLRTLPNALRLLLPAQV